METTQSRLLHRSYSADLIKAISIIAVVFIHAYSLIPFSPSYNHWVSPILRFCVPVFVMLWAYFFELSISTREKKLAYLATKFYRFLIPFFIWSAVYFFYVADTLNMSFIQIVVRYWTGYGWSGQYYFIILLQLIIFFTAISLVARSIAHYSVTVCIVSIFFYGFVSYFPWFSHGVMGKIGDRIFIYWIPYVLLGIIYARRGFSNLLAVPPMVMVCALIFIPLEYYFLHPSLSAYLVPSVFIVTVLMVNSIMKGYAVERNPGSSLSKVVKILSANTLGIFCLNPLIIIVFSRWYHLQNYNLQFPFCFVIVPLFSTFLVITTSLLIALFLKRIKLGMLV